MSNDNHPLYEKWKPIALRVKITIQMLIGLAILALLILKLALQAIDIQHVHFLTQLTRNHPLQIVGYALAISACVELAYMLYTPGPDEAIEPLILGMSSAILIVISKKHIVGYDVALTILVLTAGIGFLFWVRKQFVEEIK